MHRHWRSDIFSYIIRCTHRNYQVTFIKKAFPFPLGPEYLQDVLDVQSWLEGGP